MSSDLAKSYHSINIGDINTWDDWHIVPTSRPLIAAPRVKTSFVSIPGGDGSLDLTEVLSGRPTYERRSGSWEFVVMNDYGDWAERYSEIMEYLQGKQYPIIFDDDPEYYYVGRLAVNEWRSEPNWSRIVINYNVDPYKRLVDGFGDMWRWDPINFNTDSIRDYRKIVVSTSVTVNFVNDSLMSVTPIIGASASGMSMTYAGNTYSLSKGLNRFEGLSFGPGSNSIVFRGKGTISIDSIGGRL